MTIELNDLGGLRRKYLVRRPLFFGILASIILFSIYFVILTIANSASHAWTQFMILWYWMIPLVIGFGIQVGLYVYIRGFAKYKRATASMSAAAIGTTGGVSTGSMIACCMHHVADVLPILGISAFAIFLNKFQSLFLSIGIIGNLIGLNIMLKMIQEHSFFDENSRILSRILSINMKSVLYGTTTISAVLFITVLFKTI